MRIVALLITTSMLASCVTTPRTTPEVDLRATVRRDSVLLVARVSSSSWRPLSLVDHPDYVSLEIRAASQSAEEYVPGGCISWLRPTSESMRQLSRGSEVCFSAEVPISRLGDGRLLVGNDSCVYHPPAYRIRGRKLKAVFHYSIEDAPRPRCLAALMHPIADLELRRELPVTAP